MEARSDTSRRVFPRWRSLSRTPGHELQSSLKTSASRKEIPIENALLPFYEKWQETPTIENALDVVDRAIYLDAPFLAVGPAKMILDSDKTSETTKTLAKFVLTGPTGTNLDIQQDVLERGRVESDIRKAKKRLADEPANGLLWLEKARLHTLIGDIRTAEQSLKCAYGCAPNNRFIIRAFSRFLVHVGRPDEAHQRLVRCEGLLRDPWIQSVEIAVAETAGLSPVAVSAGKANIENQTFSPLHTSELAAAIGTLELGAGINRRAKKFFNRSLVAPTDNALSQAFWVRDELSLGLQIDKSKLSIAGAFEARMQDAVASKNWRSAVESCDSWVRDEQFSLRANIQGSFLSGSYLWDQELSLSFCNRGLIANPENRILLNNKSVALARLGRINEAKQNHKKLSQFLSGSSFDPIAAATHGLIFFRDNNHSLGRHWYEKSWNYSLDRKEYDTCFRLFFHWIYEEARAGTITLDTVASFDKMMRLKASEKGVHQSSVDLWATLRDRIDFRQFAENTAVDSIQLPLWPDI
jgi:tetratricopeptide (TPR) repeat protein